MDIVTYIIALVVTGLVAGALGRLAVPGRDPMSIPMTILVGIIGSFIGGFIGRLLFGEDSAGGLLLAVAGAALVVFLMRKMGGRRGARRV